MLLADLPADLPLLLFATADVPASGAQIGPLPCTFSYACSASRFVPVVLRNASFAARLLAA